MAEKQTQWGITAPISSKLPTEEELGLNEALVGELKKQNNFEAPEETKTRSAVIAHLKDVTQAFVRHVGQRKGLPKSLLDSAGGNVFTFGSYRLGVYGPGQGLAATIFV